MYDAVYLYTCPRCGSEGVVIGALDPRSVVCDRCYPDRLTLVEPRVSDNGEAS
jgi:transcription elongation factor Elf1